MASEEVKSARRKLVGLLIWFLIMVAQYSGSCTRSQTAGNQASPVSSQISAKSSANVSDEIAYASALRGKIGTLIFSYPYTWSHTEETGEGEVGESVDTWQSPDGSRVVIISKFDFNKGASSAKDLTVLTMNGILGKQIREEIAEVLSPAKNVVVGNNPGYDAARASFTSVDEKDDQTVYYTLQSIVANEEAYLFCCLSSEEKWEDALDLFDRMLDDITPCGFIDDNSVWHLDGYTFTIPQAWAESELFFSAGHVFNYEPLNGIYLFEFPDESSGSNLQAVLFGEQKEDVASPTDEHSERYTLDNGNVVTVYDGNESDRTIVYVATPSGKSMHFYMASSIDNPEWKSRWHKLQAAATSLPEDSSDEELNAATIRLIAEQIGFVDAPQADSKE